MTTDVRDYPAYADDEYWSRHVTNSDYGVDYWSDNLAWSREDQRVAYDVPGDAPRRSGNEIFTVVHPTALAPLVEPKGYAPHTEPEFDLKRAGAVCVALVVVTGLLIALGALYVTLQWY